MFWADSVGLKHIADRLAFYAKETNDPSLEPAPLLKKLADEGKTFASLAPRRRRRAPMASWPRLCRGGPEGGGAPAAGLGTPLSYPNPSPARGGEPRSGAHLTQMQDLSMTYPGEQYLSTRREVERRDRRAARCRICSPTAAAEFGCAPGARIPRPADQL